MPNYLSLISILVSIRFKVPVLSFVVALIAASGSAQVTYREAFLSMDADKDKVLQLEEFLAPSTIEFQKAMTRLKADGSAKVSNNGLDFDQFNQLFTQVKEKRLGILVREHDSSLDNSLSKFEFEGLQQHLGHFSKRGDNILLWFDALYPMTKQEEDRLTNNQRFWAFDVDGSGSIEALELNHPDHKVRIQFVILDADSNSLISLAEWLSPVNQFFQSIDRNRNGKLDLSEFSYYNRISSASFKKKLQRSNEANKRQGRGGKR